MKKTLVKFTAVTFAFFAFAACTSAETSEEEVAEMEGVTADITLDTDSSNVVWEGTMLGLYSHQGTTNFTEGNVSIENGMVKSGTFVVDLTSINPTDDGYDEERTPEKLVGHLSSDDFFNVSEYPTAKFEVTGSEGSTVMGNLTVRGVTNPETVENVMVVDENGTVKVMGDLTFDRTKYNVNFKMPVEDKVLSNDISLKINGVAAK